MSDPRVAIHAALAARATEAASAFRNVVGSAHPESGPPCWGDLADHFKEILATDDARIDVFEGLRAAGDLSALILFLDLNQYRHSVLAHVWTIAHELPATVQCALVSLLEWTNVSPELAARLHPAARRLITDQNARARDREFFAAQAAALRSLRTRLPQVSVSVSVARTP